VLRQVELRLRNDVETEIDATFREISEIVFGRLGRIVASESAG
jgi:2-oxo-4-hydroxy-4-carboxy--5-ureidoimidazoline (OHCU) decarboxylase